MLYCIVLYCIVLCCVVLCCIVLYCIVLYCIVLYCILSYCIVLYCIVLYCIVLYCIVLYCITNLMLFFAGFGVAVRSIDLINLYKHSNYRADEHYNCRAVLLCSSGKLLHSIDPAESGFILTRSLKHVDNLRVVLAIDVTKGMLNVYINGLLAAEGGNEDCNGITFSRLNGALRPALWVEGRGIEIMPITGLSNPGIPGKFFHRNCSFVLLLDSLTQLSINLLS